MSDQTLPEMIPLERLAEVESASQMLAKAEMDLLRARHVEEYVKGKLAFDFRLENGDEIDSKTGAIKRGAA